jgi:tripartite-type tricarboxylate transporter receptor subunit TctC
MKKTITIVLLLAGGIAVANAPAQEPFPTRAITMIVPFPP